ncbi:WecB/TagA/CpsF family glycosyltransferase [Corynebacterium hindlerae]|uniref:WecB/TagA/CpsF family glycosyltransferase n=1 Tax=Corynebacterium hindlerae TaxID=699041 RepID=A0A7G5FHP1_9CORY|nr:WecB/TagA/CpsF family glycosyltransferase [Corynebacterium hindlerae]QMV86132.1 WecB/TagA/CpsF family glycosyltransferase [Corynebacterium hindlerae]
MTTKTAFPDVVDSFAREIARPGTVVTWLNHWSVFRTDREELALMSAIGIDGTLLQLLLMRNGLGIGRTSADLVLPVLFDDILQPGSRIAVIGAEPGIARAAAQRITAHKAIGFDGFGELAELRRDPHKLHEFRPDVIVLGLGAGLQDTVALEMHRLFPEAIVCTAGGWVSQLASKQQYFPPIIHKLRLGWAWRIAHEPRRLIRRYTIDAVDFVKRRKDVVGYFKRLPHRVTATGFQR